MSTRVKLETSKGELLVEVHEEWAPVGADRFLELVRSGFYDGCPFFRVIDGFMMQTGLSPNHGLNEEWGEKKIKDDKFAHQSNSSGRLSFAMAGPHTRTSQIFINTSDNSFLDNQGFTPFGEVLEGMDVLASIHVTGENRNNEQALLHMPGGIDKVKALHPEMDFIIRATAQD